MKRILCFLLSAILLCSSSIVAFAEEAEKYITIPVEYSDNIGTPEQLEVMVKDSNVYVNAEMLANRLGYQFGNNNDCITIQNTENENIPVGVTVFFFDSTKVSHMVFSQMVDTYEAPFSSIQNEKGCWIPLEYSLLILNSGLLILEDSILIDIPQKDIIDYYVDIQKKADIYPFDWNKDFGYTETDWKVLGGISHIANLFNGILGFDGDSWAEMFQAFMRDSSSYDKKYGENLAMLFCTESDGELNASINKIGLYQNIFSKDGQLGKILTKHSANLDSEVGMLYKNCEEILKDVKEGNSSVVTYNRAYQALEDAFDRQTWFSETGGNIIEMQKSFSDATSILDTGILDIGLKVAEVVGYGNEFANQDDFSVSALTNYLDTSAASVELPDAMKQSMKDYSDILSSNLVEYSALRFFEENVDGWITDGISLNNALGTQANVALFAWNVASNTIPFISNGLDAADKFELALYSQVFQADAILNYQYLRNSVFNDIDTLSPEKLYDLTQYCYVYLKACYTTRNAAIGSLVGKSDSVKEQIQPLIDYQNSINHDIAKIMAILKTANETNEGNVYGFLPADNKKYLDEFDNSKLSNWIEHIIENSQSKVNYEMRTESIKFHLSDGTICYSNTVEYPYFLGNTKVESVLNQRYIDMISDYKANDTDFDALYQQDLERGLNISLSGYDNIHSEVVYNKKGVLSIKETHSMKGSGGAHSYHSEKGLSYDLTTGNELTYLDILNGTEEEIDKVLKYYFKKYLRSPTDYEILTLKEYTAYTLCEDGLCFYYNVGDAVDREEIIIPYTSNNTYIIEVNKLLQ